VARQTRCLFWAGAGVFKFIKREDEAVKKIMIALTALLLLAGYGCSKNDTEQAVEQTKETAHATKEAAVEAGEKAVEVTKEAATATKEAAVEAGEKAADMTKEAVDEAADKAKEMSK
jgi:flagellar biosynthesis component FlhA